MLEQQLHYLLMLGYNLSSRAIAARTSHTGLLSGQPKVLEYLLEHEGCTQKEIGEGLGLDKSTITSLLSKMAESQLIRKEPCANDRRFFHIYLTQSGKEHANLVRDIFVSWDHYAWDDISQEEQEAFLDTLLKITKRMRQPLG